MHREETRPRASHSFTTVDSNRAILIGGSDFGQVFNDAFLFLFSSLEWVEMKLKDIFIPRSYHSTIVVDVPKLGPVAFVLSGYGKEGFPLCQAQIIQIDFQECKNLSISDEPIPTGFQSICSVVSRGLLFILRYGGSPFKVDDIAPAALLDIFKFDLKNVGDQLIRHDLSEPIQQEAFKFDKNHSNLLTMNSEELSQKEREMLHPSPKRVEDVIAVVTTESVLIFTRWKKFSTSVSLDKGAEISIPNTESTLRIQPRDGDSAVSTTSKTSMSLTIFTFDAKQSHGVQDDEFVSDLIQLSLPSGLTDDDVHIEMCHEHGLSLDPTTPATSASKVVFFYQPHDFKAKTEHPIKFDKKMVIERAGERRIDALLQSFVVKVVVSPSAAAAVTSSHNSDVSCSFFTHFYGLGCQAFSCHALSFEKVNISDGWQFDLCFISTRPEHRDRYLAYRNDRLRQPLLLDQQINNLLLSPTESNVVEAGNIEGSINESRRNKYVINMQQLLAVRDSPIDAWAATFCFTYNNQELLQRLPTMAANVAIISGDRRQCLRIQCSESSSMCDRVEAAPKLPEPSSRLARVETSREIALLYNPSHLEMEDLTFHMRSQWRDIARCIVPLFTNSEIEHIELHEREDQPLRFLQAWIEKHGLDATRRSLCAALISIGLAAGAKDVFPEIYEEMTKDAILDSSFQVHPSELDYDEDQDFLGSGTFGDVFKATLKKSGKPEMTVAVKVFRKRKPDKKYEMFEKGAAILFQIDSNPFILGLIGLCAIPTFYALVTEFVSGGNLSSLLMSDEHRDAVEKWETRVKFARQIAGGMLHLHSNHPPVIHYDLKAENVLVERTQYNNEVQFNCKVSDYGLSKMTGVRSVTNLRREGSDSVDSVIHIAPERFSEHLHCDEDDKRIKMDLAKKSDVYSYGVVLWEIREEERPHKDKTDELIRLHVRSGGELPRGQATNVPPFFNDLLKRSVQLKPQERPTFRDIFLYISEGERRLDH